MGSRQNYDLCRFSPSLPLSLSRETFPTVGSPMNVKAKDMWAIGSHQNKGPNISVRAKPTREGLMAQA